MGLFRQTASMARQMGLLRRIAATARAARVCFADLVLSPRAGCSGGTALNSMTSPPRPRRSLSGAAGRRAGNGPGRRCALPRRGTMRKVRVTVSSRAIRPARTPARASTRILRPGPAAVRAPSESSATTRMRGVSRPCHPRVRPFLRSSAKRQAAADVLINLCAGGGANCHRG